MLFVNIIAWHCGSQLLLCLKVYPTLARVFACSSRPTYLFTSVTSAYFLQQFFEKTPNPRCCPDRGCMTGVLGVGEYPVLSSSRSQSTVLCQVGRLPSHRIQSRSAARFVVVCIPLLTPSSYERLCCFVFPADLWFISWYVTPAEIYKIFLPHIHF